MGIFDIDSGTDNHLLNEQFHVFSKSPASVATALGDASNRSGHTVTASDVWGQEIPAFFYAKTQSVADSYKSLAKTNDLCRIGNSVAIFENGNWVVKYNSYTDIPDGHKFKNANGDEVIRFHKNRLAYTLNLDNNAGDDGLNTTAKIQGWDEANNKVYDYVDTAPKFISQFVTSTDKIVDGIPSKGFGPFVMAGTTTGDITKVLPEGTSDPNHYIANSFAGIIQFNQDRTDAIYVHAFEYCGKTLSTAVSDIKQHSDDISTIKASLGLEETPGTGSLGSRVSDNEAALRTLIGLESDAKVTATESIATTANNAAKAAVEGVNVTSTGSNGVVASQVKSVVSLAVTPATIAADGSITDGSTNVVTAAGAKSIADKAAKDAITTALADTEGSAITEKIESEIADATLEGKIADSTETTKLVTAEQVVTYVEENAKVTLHKAENSGITIDKDGQASTEFTIGIDTDVIATKASVDGVDGRVSAIETSLASGDIHKEIDAVRTTANAAKATADSAVQSVTRASGSSELITVTDGTDVTISLSTEVATKSDITTEIGKLTAEGGSVKTLQTEVAGIKTSLATGGATANAIKAAQDTADQAVRDAADAKAAGEAVGAAALTEAQKRISKVSEGTDSSLLTVETTGTEVTITLDSDVATKTHVTGEIKTVTDAATALTGRVSTIETSLATGGATANAIADAKKAGTDAATAVTTLKDTDITAQTVSGAGISVTLDGTVGAPTLTGSVTTASYTSATKTTAGSWTDETKVATGAAVKAAIADINTAHTKDIQTVTAAVKQLSTSGFERVIVTELPTGDDIKLNAIYLVKNTNSEAGEYIEHIYVQSLGKFEQIGSTKTDLSEYAKTTDVTSAIATAKAEAIADAKGKVDALAETHATDKAELEGAISGVSQVAASTQTQVTEFIGTTYATDKKTLEDSIKAVSDKVGESDVNAQIIAKIDAIGTGVTQGAAGVTLTQSKGIVSLTVAPGEVKSGNTSVVTGGAVFAAVDVASSAASAAQTSANKKLASIGNDGDTRVIIGTPTADGDTKSVTIKLASTVATTTDGTAYSKTEADAAVKVAKDAADSKIAAVEVTTDAATHLGAHHVSATTDTNKKVTVSVSCSDEWEYTGDALTGVATVINGKMSDGKTIDDANLTKAESMFAGNTTLTTYVGSLGKLTNGKNMFKGCTGLTTFVADLTSLTDGTDMFEGCALTEESLMYIVDSLPVVTTTKTITVDVAGSVTNKATYAAEALLKGWNLA